MGNDLSNQYVSQSYQSLVQISGSTLTDGLGNTINYIGSGARILITSASFTSGSYTNTSLINLTPIHDFNVYVNVGRGVSGNGSILNPNDGYTFNSGSGQLTMIPDNYLIQIY